MKCECCGKLKMPLESFEDITDGSNKYSVCVKCSNLLYHIRHSMRTNDVQNKEKYCFEIENRMKKGANTFKDWYRRFLLTNSK